MKLRWFGILAAVFVALSSTGVSAVGFTQTQIPDTNNPNMTIGVWYPTDTPAPAEPNTRFGMALAVDAPIVGANGGLVVISHGYGGWYAGHADTAVALAAAGYIVAAPSHTGNNGMDMSSPPHKWLLDRPRHMSLVIDYLLASDLTSSHLTASKIGVFGFSAGGYTALGLIGGVPDLKVAQNHCVEFPQEFVCAEGLIGAMVGAGMDALPAKMWGADKRIRAAAIAAPGSAFAYPQSSLTNVTADVQLWSGMLDESVPTDTNAALLAARLPVKPETHWIPDASHFAFLITPCREIVKQEEPEEYALLCTDAPGFDRQAFHKKMNGAMVRFFNDSLDVVE